MKEGSIIQQFKQHSALINQALDRTANQHRLMNSTMILLKNYNARLETIQELLIENNIIDSARFEQLTDAKLGLRLLGPQETIKIGDVVWCEYEAFVDGEMKAKDVLPVRVGSQAIVFEPALIGKSPNTEGIEYSNTFVEKQEDGTPHPLAGQTMAFKIKIGKVKTRLHEGVQDGQSGEQRADAPAAESEVSADPNGSQFGESGEQLSGSLQQ